MNSTSKHAWGMQLVGLAFLALLPALLAACGGAPPRIVVEPTLQDLGQRPQELIALTYKIRNEGGSPLRIEKISTSCDCTQAIIDRDTIPPGETAALRVTLDPAEDNLYGKIQRVTYIRSNDPATPEVEAEFRVTILKPGSMP